MKSSVLKTCLTAALLSSAALTGAAEVYTWKGTSGNSYSDTPNRLQPKRSGVVNIRTHNVKPAVAPAVAASEPVAEQPNEQVAEQNKQIEERNKKSKNKTAKTSWKTAKSPKSTAKSPKAHAWPIATA
ncbi:hypothetical protein TW91_1654 [Neisseria flavescens]|nr:hypothetical protein TW91_1654 [Neisseria flavescens]